MRIETDRLILREWKSSDKEDLIDGLNHFDTAKNLTVPFPYTESDADAFLSKFSKSDKNKFYFAVEHKAIGKVIGGTNFNLNDDGSNSGGIWINHKFHGQGFGTEVFSARARFAFEFLKVEKIYNGFFEFNKTSFAMQQKLGYKIVGCGKSKSGAHHSRADYSYYSHFLLLFQ